MRRGRTWWSAFDNPKYFGFTLRRTGSGAIGEDDLANQDLYFQAAPSTVGTIAYIAYETRRLFEAMKLKKESWAPLEITALGGAARLRGARRPQGNGAAKAKCPPTARGRSLTSRCQICRLARERRSTLFSTISGWNGYVGFVRESTHADVIHVGAAPDRCGTSSRKFTRKASPQRPNKPQRGPGIVTPADTPGAPRHRETAPPRRYGNWLIAWNGSGAVLCPCAVFASRSFAHPSTRSRKSRVQPCGGGGKRCET